MAQYISQDYESLIFGFLAFLMTEGSATKMTLREIFIYNFIILVSRGWDTMKRNM